MGIKLQSEKVKRYFFSTIVIVFSFYFADEELEAAIFCVK